MHPKLAFLRFRKESTTPLAAELLLSAPPKGTVEQQAQWAVRMLKWIHAGGAQRTTRLRYLLQQLEKKPEQKLAVSATLRALAEHASALDLLTETGFSLEAGLFGELFERILARLVPAPARYDWLEILVQAGWGEQEALWIRNLPSDIWEKVAGLFAPAEEGTAATAFSFHVQEAMLFLAAGVAHLGLSERLRSRHRSSRIVDSPFLHIEALLLESGGDRAASPPPGLNQEEWDATLGRCRQALRAVYADMETSGVSVGLVYRLEILNATLARLDDLLVFQRAAGTESQEARWKTFLTALLSRVQDRKSIRGHLRAHLYLLSRKVVERNGASGEHYLAGDSQERRQLFWSGIGGGLVVVLMTTSKILLHHLPIPPALFAFGSFVIYSAGFLTMQFARCTLATKLPSFLAAHIARQLASLKGKAEAALIRQDIKDSFLSQGVALLGNLAGVIPFGLFLIWAGGRMGFSFFTPAQALAAAEDVRPLRSLALPLAALTGLELWVSSLAGGWFENWLVFRRVPAGLETQPVLRLALGEEGAKRFAAFLLKHASGIAANLTLGFLFGFVPLLGLFLGFTTESRHVTIASTTTLFAVGSLNPGELTWQLGLALFVGLGLVGVLNFAVSFALALSVAARATGVKRSWWIWLWKRA